MAIKFLVTGAAGFIGFHVCQQLIQQGHRVIGLDNLNDYYEVSLKQSRLEQLNEEKNFSFVKMDLADRDGVASLFNEHQFQRVIHLAAQAGVRYSLDNPMAYVDSNLVGHMTILEGCRNHHIEHLVYASSSSVYGLNSKMPFSTQDSVDHPVSLYAATKKANELMSHTYSHLYGLPTTGLRFFTVYGPWGRPDMAPMKFAKAILTGESIDVYNNGNLSRDFTYVDDIVDGILGVQAVIPEVSDDTQLNNNPGSGCAPFRVYNIGHGSPVKLMDFIAALESALGVEAQKNFLPMQPGDVYATYADTTELSLVTGYKPKVNIADGVERFVQWYRNYYQI